MHSERGQATIEWVGLVCLAAVALGALALAVPVVDGRSFGGFLSHRIVCAVRGAACADGALVRAYGRSDAELVRRFAPGVAYEPGERQLPVDYRRCRAVACARAPDDRDLDVHRTDAGGRATLFTRVVRAGGRTYIQYWFYYPDSNSAVLGSDRAWRRARGAAARPAAVRQAAQAVPGLSSGRLGGPSGADRPRWPRRRALDLARPPPVVQAGRVPRHAGGRGRGGRGSRAAATPATSRSSGQCAGQRGGSGGRAGTAPRGRMRTRYRPRLPGVDLRERTSTPEGIELVPLERIDKRGYRRLGEGVSPPWQKRGYDRPEDPHS